MRRVGLYAGYVGIRTGEVPCVRSRGAPHPSPVANATSLPATATDAEPRGTTMTTTPSAVGSARPRTAATPAGAVRPERSDTGLAPVRGRRRPWLLGLGAFLAAVGSLTVVWLVGAAGERQEVLAVRADVAYGEVVTADDITIARVSVDPGIAVLPGADRDSVVGQVATTRLAPGMLLTEGMVEPDGEPGPGRVLVPIAVPAERMPAGGLRAGDRILAVDSEAAGPDAGASVRRGADRCDRRARRSGGHQRGHGRRCDDDRRGRAQVGRGRGQRPCRPHRRADRELRWRRSAC